MKLVSRQGAKTRRKSRGRRPEAVLLAPWRLGGSNLRQWGAFGAVDRALTALERNAGTKVVAEWLAGQL